MCTKEEVREVIEDVLNDHDDQGETLLGREVNLHITNKGNDIIAKLTIRFGVTLTMFVIGASGAYYALISRVSSLEDITVDNSEEIEKGGRYTREDALTRDAEVQRQILELKESDAELREDQIEATNAVRSDIRELRGLILAQ